MSSSQKRDEEESEPGTRDSGQIALAGIFAACFLAIFITIPLVTSTGSMPPAPPGFEHEGYVGRTFKRLSKCAPDPPFGTSYAGEPDAESSTNPRVISNTVFHQEESIESDVLAALWWLFGQFLDHELTESHPNGDLLSINITGDPYFVTKTELTINRVEAEIDDEGCRLPRNFHTSFIDASNVYSYNATFLNTYLRDSTGGRLKTSPGDMLPFKPGTDEKQFICGDHRCMEHAGLTSMHTLWVREHNHWAKVIQNLRGDWTHDQIFWKARQVVIAEIQHIVYTEWLPALLGSRAYILTEPAPKYNPDLHPDIYTEFAVAAYRLGHSMVNNHINLKGGESISLVQLFTQSLQMHKPGTDIGRLLQGFTKTRAQRVDDKVVSGLRNFLFGPIGMDLVTMNIARGREIGVARYGEILKSVMGKFGPETESTLDPLLGMLQEPHIEGSQVGETMATIIGKQFRELRDSDPNFYLWDSQKEAIGHPLYNEINTVTMKRILIRNTDLTESDLNENAFIV